MNSAILPSWLVADLRRSQPSVAGSTAVAQAFVATLRTAGIAPAVDANESARATIRVTEVPVTPLGALDMAALLREVDLASDYVAAFPANGFDARQASSTVQQGAYLVAAIVEPRPCLVYARPAAIARNSASLDTTGLLSRLAAAQLRGRRAELRHEQALDAAASAWSELRASSEETLRLKRDLNRLTIDMQRRDQEARKLADAVALAERLLHERGDDYVSVIPAVGLFRKRRAGEASSPADRQQRHIETLADIASMLSQARTDWSASLEPAPRSDT